MEPNTQNRSHAKDVFLNLAALVALYSSVGALLSILFTVIQKAYPVATSYYSTSISFPVASLIILFPLYILFMWLIEKDLTQYPDRRTAGIRKWLVYITLFIAGGLIVGDLVAVVYKFIDGQDLTASFLYKALSIVVVAGMVFGYYITDARNKITARCKKTALITSTLLVIVVIGIGFSVIGSPKNQRLMRYDQVKMSELQTIAQNVQYFVEKYNRLPADLAELKSGYSYGGFNITDSQTGVPYEYTIFDSKSYNLCAVFNLDSSVGGVNKSYYDYRSELWNVYKKGRYCFTNTVLIQPSFTQE